MIITINEKIKINEELPLIKSYANYKEFPTLEINIDYPMVGFAKKQIQIKDQWFDVISPSELVRKRNEDGYFRVIYIQINTLNGEYYIGKANRKSFRELKRYSGSGVRFKSKYNKHKHNFVRYYIAACSSAEETELLESSIVNEELILDKKCLNIVCGGGGVAPIQTSAETREKKRQYMLNNPKQSQPMLNASKELFQSGSTIALKSRNENIKQTMNTDFHRELSRERIKNWKLERPEEYQNSRRKSLESIKSPEVQAKRVKTLKKNREANPERYKQGEANRITACKSEKSRAKQRDSMKKFREANPEKAALADKKRAKAAAAKTSKEICMLELETNKVLQTFPSQQAAARWLVEKGIAKNTNCVSSIGAVCLRKKCTTGYGYRKKAYGYDWRFKSEIMNE